MNSMERTAERTKGEDSALTSLLQVVQRCRPEGVVDVDEQNIQAPHIEKALYTVVSRKRALADDPAVLVGIFWESIDHPKMVPGSLSGMEAEVDEVGDCTPSSSDDGIHALEMQSEASQRSLTMNEAEHADAVSRAGVELEPESNEVAIPKASDIDPARPHPVSKTADTSPDDIDDLRPNIPGNVAYHGEFRKVVWTGFSGLAVLYRFFHMVFRIVYYAVSTITPFFEYTHIDTSSEDRRYRMNCGIVESLCTIVCFLSIGSFCMSRLQRRGGRDGRRSVRSGYKPF